MKAEERLWLHFDGSHGNVRTPFLVILGPLIGLGFIIILPFVALLALSSLLAYRAKQGLFALGRRAIHRHIADVHQRV